MLVVQDFQTSSKRAAACGESVEGSRVLDTANSREVDERFAIVHLKRMLQLYVTSVFIFFQVSVLLLRTIPVTHLTRLNELAICEGD